MSHTKLVITAFIFLLSFSANAALFNIDFESSPFANSSVQNSIVYNFGDDVVLTISAYSLVNDGVGNITSRTLLSSPSGVYDGSSGLGVSVGGLGSSDDNDLDGGDTSTDPDEGLLFSFNKLTELTAINFGGFSSNDDFNLEVDGINLMYDIGQFDTDTGGLIVSTPENDKFNFDGIIGFDFLVWADGDSDDFRIDDITVQVPEPSVLALMGLGLAGLWVSRRRKP